MLETFHTWKPKLFHLFTRGTHFATAARQNQWLPAYIDCDQKKQRELSSQHLTKNHLCYWCSWAKRRRHSMLSLPISTSKVSFAHVAYCLYLTSRSFSSASSVGIRTAAWKAAADTLICGQHLHAVADPQNRLSYCEDRWVEPRGIFCVHRVWSSRYNDSSADKR